MSEKIYRHGIETEMGTYFECICGFKYEGDDSHYVENKHLAWNLPAKDRKTRLAEIEATKHTMTYSYHELKYTQSELNEALSDQLATILAAVEEMDSDKIATEIYGEHAKEAAFCDGCTYGQNMAIIKSDVLALLAEVGK